MAAATGAVLSQGQFPTSPAGLARAADWIARHAPGKRLVGIEGTGSYGATLTRLLIERGQDVCEVKPPARTARAGKGKTDDIDALAAARSVLSVEADHLIRPRADGIRAAVSVLLAARKSIDGRRTADRNVLTMLLRTYALGIDARRSLTPAQLEQIAAWRARPSDDAAAATIRGEAHRLAQAVQAADIQLEDNHQALEAHVRALAGGLLEIPGLGPVTGASCCPPGPTTGASAPRLRSPPWPAPPHCQPPQATPPATASHAAATASSTAPWTSLPGSACPTTPPPAPTSSAASPREKHDARSDAASSATSPDRSSVNSTPSLLDSRHRSVTRHQGGVSVTRRRQRGLRRRRGRRSCVRPSRPRRLVRKRQPRRAARRCHSAPGGCQCHSASTARAASAARASIVR